MPTNHLGYMTWPEVKAAAARKVPVLIPMGTVETQGLHSPIGFDYIVAERLAEAVATREDCIVCPTLPFGYSHFSRRFPGTISLRPDTVRGVVFDVAESLLRHGFRHLIFVDRHTLNDPMRQDVAEELRERYGVCIASVFPTSLAPSLSRDLYEMHEGVFAHGGEPGVSLLLYLTPDAMKMEGVQKRLIATPWHGFDVVGPHVVRLGESTVNIYVDYADLAPTGGLGDPTQASVEKGRIMFERMVEFVVHFVARFREVEM